MTAFDACDWCNEPIEPRELAGGRGAARFHRDCLVRVMFGSVAHQRRACVCYHGIEGDPPNMTRRQAATLAAVEARRSSERFAVELVATIDDGRGSS